MSKFDICGSKDRTCFNCPYQDSNYCPYEQDTPHGWIWWISIKLTTIVAGPIIIFLLLIEAL